MFLYLLCLLDKSDKLPIKLEDFCDHIVSIKAQNGAKLIQEFESLVINAPFTNHAAKLLRNKTKNRYNNVIPCKLTQLCVLFVANSQYFLLDDHSRVVLSQQDLLGGSDYINASHIDVSFVGIVGTNSYNAYQYSGL